MIMCYRGWGVGKGLVGLKLDFIGKRGEKDIAESTTCRPVQECLI